MRLLLALTLFAAACAANSPGGGKDFDSVRDRLSEGPTRLVVATADSTGSIGARRRVSEGWAEGVTPVTIESGDLSAKVDSKGAFVVDKLLVSVAPIDIPEDVFKKPAQLTDVKLTLTSPASASMTWTGNDDAMLTLPVSLDFDWAILVNGGKTPLATQHLPAIMIDVALTGAGDHVDASLSLHATGELWNWANLLEMTSLDLALSAGTVD